MTPDASPDVSIVLPCFRNAAIAAESVAELSEFFLAAGLDAWEAVVVDDGGGDFPADPWPDEPRTRLVTLPRNRGKGAAVVAGMTAARGRARIFTDVDLPYGTELFPAMADYLARGFHMVIGDRTMPTSRYHDSISLQRRLVSGLSSKLIGSLVTGGFFDTQCGLKAVRGDVADLVFPLIRLERFAFDVELIYIALVHRLDIKRVPVRLRENQTSSVHVLRDSVRGVVDVLRIKHHQLRGLYDSEELPRLVLDEIAGVRAAAALGSGVTAT
jgi:dolichyl-phosphate beta-glucosyltransferase